MTTTTNEKVEQWYALQTYYAQELKVGHYLEKHRLHFFIPMMYSFDATSDDEPRRHQHPVVHNLIFIERTVSDTDLLAVLKECPYSVRIYTYPNEQRWQVIPAQDILELRMICDNSFVEPQFISQQESELKIGRMVQVVHGPMKGITGKLVRKNKKYYIVKSFVGLGVMVSVSRWCCEELLQE